MVAIIGFIIIGILAISGIWPLAKNVSGVANLYNNAGFMPHGMGGILAAILITAFSFFGVEIVSIAAAESSNPKQKIRRATNLVLYRIILFFRGLNVYCGFTCRLAFTGLTKVRDIPIRFNELKRTGH